MKINDLEGKTVEVQNSKEELGKKIGGGAEGVVYHIEGNNNQRVAKIFQADNQTDKFDKICAMIENEPIDPTHENLGIHSIVWPTHIVTETGASSGATDSSTETDDSPDDSYISDPGDRWGSQDTESISQDNESDRQDNAFDRIDTGSFLGYTMPFKNLDRHRNIRRYTREELQWDQSDEKERYRVAYNLAIVVNAVHIQGHALGDLNYKNILIENGYVSLIDCDGFHISGQNETYDTETWFEQYAPPEGPADTIEEDQQNDRFGLGIHIFQILMEGFHPYQAQGDRIAGGRYYDWIKKHPFPYENPEPGIRPHDRAPDYDELPTDIRDLFARCFVEDEGKRDGSVRPDAEEWYKTLKQFLEDSNRISNPFERYGGTGSSADTTDQTDTDTSDNTGSDTDDTEITSSDEMF